MGRIDEKELKMQLKNDNLSKAYFIYGEESYLKEYYVSKIRAKLVSGSFEEFNLHRFDGKQDPVDDILKDADLLPMMGGCNLVLACDYPFDKSENDCKEIKEYLTDIPETTVLVFWYNSLEPDVKKSARWKGVEAAFAKYGSSISFSRKSETDLVKLLVSGCRKRGAELSQNNARYLISVSGCDIKTLLNEVQKLSAFANGAQITKEMIDKLAVKCLQARIYDLSNAVVRGNYDKAYAVLDSLFAAKEDPVKVLSAISGCFVDMYRVKCAKTAGMPFDDVAFYFNYRGREFALKNASRDSAALSFDQLRRSLDVIMLADNGLKSTSADSRLILEEMLVKLLLISKEVRYD
mgnify:FL=1